MKKTITILSLVLAVILNPVSSAAGVSIDDGWPLLDLPIQGYFSVQFMDGRANLSNDPGAPYLSWKDGTYTGRGPRQLLCESLNDKKCSLDQGTFQYFNRLSLCADSNALDCIEGIEATLNGVSTKMDLSESFPKKNLTTYSGDSSAGLSNASSGSIWTISGAPHSKGDKYFVDVRLRGSKKASDKQFSVTSLGIGISAVDLVKTINDAPDAAGGMVQNGTVGAEYLGAIGIYPAYINQQVDCVMSGDGLCADRRGMPDGLAFKVKLRLSSSPSGWLHGRLSNPDISIEPIGSTSAVRVSISGGSIRVPSLGVGKMWKDLSPSMQAKYLAGGFNPEGAPLSCRWCDSNPLINTTVSHPKSSGIEAINELKAWLPEVNDKASADINTWSIRTLDDTEMSGATSCFANKQKLLGLVTTNSTVYSAGPPAFDGSSLNYQVAAPHLMSSGELTKGDYKLILRSDAARCIYNFTSAPIKATISVIGESGNTDVASTVVNESNGWLTLSASNFTFSNPTIKVKLTQDKAVVVPAPVETKAPVVAAPTKSPVIKKITITCVKGKTTKKVTAVKPTCPSGYKKK